MNENMKRIHDIAENTKLSQLLISGEMTKEQWASYLYNQKFCYNVIEQRGVITNKDVLRFDRLNADHANIRVDQTNLLSRETVNYCQHVSFLPDEALWAHIYVRYLGDLYGGKMIAKANQWPSTYLEFDNRSNCIDYIRENSKHVQERDLIDAFEWVIKTYDGIYEILPEKSTT